MQCPFDTNSITYIATTYAIKMVGIIILLTFMVSLMRYLMNVVILVSDILLLYVILITICPVIVNTKNTLVFL